MKMMVATTIEKMGWQEEEQGQQQLADQASHILLAQYYNYNIEEYGSAAR
jgi:hypothetical protein